MQAPAVSQAQDGPGEQRGEGVAQEGVEREGRGQQHPAPWPEAFLRGLAAGVAGHLGIAPQDPLRSARGAAREVTKIGPRAARAPGAPRQGRQLRSLCRPARAPPPLGRELRLGRRQHGLVRESRARRAGRRRRRRGGDRPGGGLLGGTAGDDEGGRLALGEGLGQAVDRPLRAVHRREPGAGHSGGQQEHELRQGLLELPRRPEDDAPARERARDERPQSPRRRGRPGPQRARRRSTSTRSPG